MGKCGVGGHGRGLKGLVWDSICWGRDGTGWDRMEWDGLGLGEGMRSSGGGGNWEWGR